MIPKETDHAEIVEFMVNSGLPETYKDNISIKSNGTVIINQLQSQECEILIAAIHTKTSFGRRLYCNGVVPRTPDKPAHLPAVSVSPGQQSSVTIPNTEQSDGHHQPAVTMANTEQSTGQQPAVTMPSTENSPVTPASTTIALSTTNILPHLVSPMSPNQFSQQHQIPETPDVHHMQMSNDQLVRRNSLSLRSPPLGSLAREILGTANYNQGHRYEKAKSIISGLKEMTERFSDFASAKEFSSSGSEGGGYSTQGRKKIKSRKHRMSTSPQQDTFLKKANNASSPQYYD